MFATKTHTGFINMSHIPYGRVFVILVRKVEWHFHVTLNRWEIDVVGLCIQLASMKKTEKMGQFWPPDLPR